MRFCYHKIGIGFTESIVAAVTESVMELETFGLQNGGRDSNDL